MEFRTFKAPSTARLTVAEKVTQTVKRAATRATEVASPSFAAFCAAFKRAPQATHEVGFRANTSAPSKIAPAPKQPQHRPVAASPDMAAALRAARGKK